MMIISVLKNARFFGKGRQSLYMYPAVDKFCSAAGLIGIININYDIIIISLQCNIPMQYFFRE